MTITASVLNRIPNDVEYKGTYPEMKGKGDPGLHEIHIFLSELNPSEERVKSYYKAVEDWNALHPELTRKMKACYLALVFRNSNGSHQTVKVMQSARYFPSDNTDQVVKECHKDADFFAERGFSVIREKIEATAYGIDGIPQTDADTAEHPTKYFEFHIKVGHKEMGDSYPLTEQEVEKLKKISREFTSKFGVPIPLSYNCNKDGVSGDGLGYQRFLNVRFRNQGILSIRPKVDEITHAIHDAGLRVIKTISEYVWYDSLTKLDHGWIDFNDDELAPLMVKSKNL